MVSQTLRVMHLVLQRPFNLSFSLVEGESCALICAIIIADAVRLATVKSRSHVTHSRATVLTDNPVVSNNHQQVSLSIPTRVPQRRASAPLLVHSN
jgi:hypothetical protein